jgi:hypothetical protein
MRIQRRQPNLRRRVSFKVVAALVASTHLLLPLFTTAQSEGGKRSTWQSIQFGIVKLNDVAPISWNIYHGEKKGLLLVRLWKRYLFVDVRDEEVYDVDPQKIRVVGDAIDWSLADVPHEPIDTPEFKERNVGIVDRVRFRLGKDGHYVELQIPMDPTGKPIY